MFWAVTGCHESFEVTDEKGDGLRTRISIFKHTVLTRTPNIPEFLETAWIDLAHLRD